MACEPISIINDANAECAEVDGGINASFILRDSDISGLTFDASGVLTGITLDASGSVAEFEFDDDNSAFYNQEGTRDGLKYTVNQTAFFKFSGLDKDKIYKANQIKGCCKLVAIHFANDGSVHVQGIQYNLDTTEWEYSKERARVTPSVLTDTGENVSRMEYTINSVSKSFVAADPATITKTYMRNL